MRVRAVAAAACLIAGASALAGPPSASAGACLAGNPGAVLVAYTRTGGLAGTRETLTVSRSGRATASGPRGSATRTFVVGCTRLKALRDVLVQARFGTLKRVYAPDDPFADGYIESVRYGARTVRVMTGAEVPARLARVLGLLRRDVARR
jgi:hypothetical protein